MGGRKEGGEQGSQEEEGEKRELEKGRERGRRLQLHSEPCSVCEDNSVMTSAPFSIATWNLFVMFTCTLEVDLCLQLFQGLHIPHYNHSCDYSIGVVESQVTSV